MIFVIGKGDIVISINVKMEHRMIEKSGVSEDLQVTVHEFKVRRVIKKFVTIKPLISSRQPQFLKVSHSANRAFHPSLVAYCSVCVSLHERLRSTPEDMLTVYGLKPDFNLASTNLTIDTQLYDGVRFHLVTYLSSWHHFSSERK